MLQLVVQPELVLRLELLQTVMALSVETVVVHLVVDETLEADSLLLDPSEVTDLERKMFASALLAPEVLIDWLAF